MDKVAIFIPTYKRAERIPKVFKNAVDSSPLITNVYFIVEKDDPDSIKILEENKIPYFLNERAKNWAGAINTAYLKTDEKYFYGGADDLDFKPGWLEITLKKMVDPIKITGTNDLHNRHVLRGEHATHFLIDRDYIRQRSGIFDEENLVAPECYLHNFADTEIIQTAILRGVFAPCLESVVEHHHWAWGLAEKDKTYQMQEGTRNHDDRLWHQRRPLIEEKVKSELESGL